MTRTTRDGSKRRALIALNSSEQLPREVICRLGQEFDSWASRPAKQPAAALDLPHRFLPEARRLLAETEALAGREERRAAALGAQLLTVLDPGYPEPLLDLALPPPVLYCLGEIPTGPATAIVGSRAADSYGREAATLFGRELAAAGLTIVSGMARGVDTAAHRGALAASGGLTVGVLGCGLDVAYPPGGDRLRRQISEDGAVITEFPFGATPRPWNFPIRNRIIAALAGGTLVVQGEARSGSLITARLAMELGRDVYAVPGRIFDSRSAGPNLLIRDGALAAQSPRDILDSLSLADRDRLPMVPEEEDRGAARSPPGLAAGAARLLSRMTPGEALPLEKLTAGGGLGVDRVLALLLELELAGHLRREPGPVWCRRA